MEEHSHRSNNRKLVGIAVHSQRSNAIEIEEQPRNSEDNDRLVQLVDEYSEVFGKGELNTLIQEPMVIKLKKKTMCQSQSLFQEGFLIHERTTKSDKFKRWKQMVL